MWRATTDKSLGTLLSKTVETAARITHLEKAPLPPPPPPPPTGWILGGVHLNRAPSSRASPSASAGRFCKNENAQSCSLNSIGYIYMKTIIVNQGMLTNSPIQLDQLETTCRVRLTIEYYVTDTCGIGRLHPPQLKRRLIGCINCPGTH